MIHKVKLEQDLLLPSAHKVYIDDEWIKYVKDINLDLTSDSLPEVEIRLYALPEFDGYADVKINLDPQTIAAVISILRSELAKHGELYNGFLASIKSACKDVERGKCGMNGLEEHILKRIIGEE